MPQIPHSRDRKQLGRLIGGCVLFAFSWTLAPATDALAAGSIELVSRANPGWLSDTATGTVLNDALPSPALSADGRFVAFLSPARNLVAGQREPVVKTGADVFLHDRVSGATTLVSHATASPTTASALGAESFTLSADGRFAAFISQSTDLVPGQPESLFSPRHLFLFDRIEGTTTAVDDALTVPDSNAFGARDLAISGNGRFLAFTSDAPDLVPGQQEGNHGFDVFLYDRVTAKTVLVSHVPASATTTGNQDVDSASLSLSADGRFVAFSGVATDLAPGSSTDGNVFLYDRLSAAVLRIGSGALPSISAGGGAVLFFSGDPQVVPGQIDPQGTMNAFLYDRAAGTTALVSHAAGLPTTTADGDSRSAYQSRSVLSTDGRYAAFLSLATNLVPGQRVSRPGAVALFLYDRATGTVVLASRSGNSATTPGNRDAEAPSLSGDGRFLAFASGSPDQVAGQVELNSDRDIFLFDRDRATTVLASAASASPPTTGDSYSYAPTISAGGSQIAFNSLASDLQAGVKDLSGGQDVVLYDVTAGSDTYVTLHAPDEPSVTPGLASTLRGSSGDGRFVLYESDGLNLAAGQIDRNQRSDVFLYDHTTRTSLLVSRSAASPTTTGDAGSSGSVLSADGRYVAYVSAAGDLVAGVNDQPVEPATGLPMSNDDVFLFDRTTRRNTLVTRSATNPGFSADRASGSPAISADGRYVAFVSAAIDLVAGLDDENSETDVFLWDRVTGATTLVSRSSASATRTAHGTSSAPSLSADGRYVVYVSTADDLVPGQTGASGFGSNVFLYDRVTGTAALVSHSLGVANDGAGASEIDIPSLSADGRYVLFSSFRNDLGGAPAGFGLNTYLYDRVSGNADFVGWTNSSGTTRRLTLSADGRWAAYLSSADLVPGIANPDLRDQLYLYDRIAKTLKSLTPSLTETGLTSQGSTDNPSISADGRFVAFDSTAQDLVAGETGTGRGVFLYDRIPGTTALVSRAPAAAYVTVGSFAPRISADGRTVAFNSDSADLVAGDFNGLPDTFQYRADSVPSGPVALPPCTLFNGPPLRSNVRKTLAVAGACGVPAGAKQVTLKLTVAQGTGKGNVQLYPAGVTAPASGILRFARGETHTAGFTLPLGNGGIALLPFVAGRGTVRVTVEVDGYTP